MRGSPSRILIILILSTQIVEPLRNLHCYIKIQMSKDPKYLSLRRKLDELKFTETLHPDSVDLVDRLYKEFFKVMSDLQI